MPARYGQDAIDLCRKLYCDHGGNNAEVEKAMRKVYPSWTRQNLVDRDDRLGWITKYGFEKALKLSIELAVGEIEPDDQRRYKAIVMLADAWQDKALSGDDKAVDKFIKLTSLQVELRNKLDLKASTFETFVDAFEQIVTWSKEVDVNLAKLFYKHRERFIEKAGAHYGKSATN
ncbi:MAG TPA: hypothetical protein VMM38_01375 [Aridibacter sp.]|nr:hypothetical protein [Aridibacter sp.]